MINYSHQFSITFKIHNSTHPDGKDISATDLRMAILRHIANTPDEVLVKDANELPFITDIKVQSSV